MSRFVVTVEQKIDVEAQDEKEVKKLLREERPVASMTGWSDHQYSVKPRKRVKVVEIRRK